MLATARPRPSLRLFTFSFPSEHFEHFEHLFGVRVPTSERTEQNTLECSVVRPVGVRFVLFD
jgi:hypothetical protein